MTFRQIAIRNVQRNAKAYLAYFLSSVFSIFVFFLFAVQLFHPRIGDEFTSGPVHLVLSAGEIAIAIFSLLFILFSVGTFLKTRLNEFGLLTLLGATRKQIDRLISLESMIIGLAAMATAIVAGLILSKYFLLFVSIVLEVPELEFYIPLRAISLTVTGFLVIFVLISILAPRLVRSKTIIELLKGNRKPKQPPKASLWLSIAGLLFIAAGYVIVVFQIAMPFDLGVISVLVSAGTYLFYSQFSVFTLKQLTSRPKLFFRKTNLLWISDLAYRMKDNARLLFVITVTCTVSFTAMAAFFAVYRTMEEEFAKSYPLPFNYISYSIDANRENNLAFISSKLAEQGLTFEEISIHFLELDDRPSLRATVAISNGSYNRMAERLKRKPMQLNSGEAVQVAIWANKANTRFAIKGVARLGNADYRLVGVIQDNLFPEGALGKLFVLNDSDFERQATGSKIGTYTSYALSDWTGPAAVSAAETIADRINTDFDLGFMYLSAPNWYKVEQLTYKLIMFVGAFISVAFLIGAASFIYFRFYTDAQEEREKYRSLRKIGLTVRELKTMTTVQLALLFYIPFAVAALHTVFALRTLQHMMAASLGAHAALVLLAFFAVLSAYFLLLRSRYLQSLIGNIK